MNEPNLETKPKRILLASHMFGRFGGLEIYNLTVSHVLQKHGAIVQVISCLTSRNNVFEQVNVKGLMPNNFLLKRVYGRTWPYWLKRSLNSLESNYDLAIAGHVMVLPQVVDYAFQQNIPCWLIVFGIDIWGDWSREVEEAIEKCEQIIAISEYTADSVRRRLAGRKERVVVIHNSVDVNKFFPMNKKHTADDPLIILTVGRLAASERYKGHDLVISALPTVQKNIRQKVEYWIIGDGDDRSRLEQLAYSQGVSDIVRFLGRIEENQLIESYRKCDVFAMPSYVEQRSDGSWAGEGFGFVYIEAAACGKPVIACDVGGQTDAVLDGITGLLVKPTVDSVADALIELLTDREKAAQMGEAGRRFVVENFSSETFDQKWANLFNKLASR